MLSSVSAASPLAVIVLDLKGHVCLWNKAAETTFGWKSQEVIGRLLPIVPEEMREDFFAHLGSVTRGEGFSGLERPGLRKDGGVIDIRITSSPIKDKNGEILSVMALIEDVSAKKRLEKEFQQAQKMEAVGRLAGGVAHDFNNILTAIGGYASFLLAGLAADDPNRADVEEIKTAGERAADLTRQLLAFSRQQILQPKVMDLNAAVRGIEKMLRRLIGEDLEIVTALQPGLGCVKADPGQIEQVIMNLVVNSRDAMPRGGRIIIETADAELDDADARTHPGVRPGRYVMLAVRDTGCGMDARTQARLFEPFFTTKEQGKGTGLGLASVYGIVKQSGGGIYVQSELGQGTTFQVFLPRVEQALKAPEQSPENVASLSGSETILLVEDDETVRKFLRRILSQNGYTVLAARNPEEAMQVCERGERPIDLLVTDMVMPQLHGRELARRLSERRPGLKVIYMSGYTDRSVVQDDLLDRGLPFLQKPLSGAAVAVKVREVLDGAL